MSNYINVDVIGFSGSGMSTIIEIIQKALMEKGIGVELINPDENHPLNPQTEDARIAALVSKKTVVTIDELHINSRFAERVKENELVKHHS